jgi:hypothetical protein
LTLDDANVARLRTFFTLNDLKFDFIAFIELLSAGVVSMNKNVLAAAIWRNESETFT